MEEVCQIHGQELVTYFVLVFLILFLFFIYLLIGKVIFVDACMLN